ncbi:MAG: methionyl-tRNA formyltransferase [Caldimicrobium sp.]
MKKYRTLFFGTPEFVIPVLDFLYQNEELIGVVTQPDKPKGRGLSLSPSPVKVWALGRRLKVFEPQKLKDSLFLSTLKELSPDLIVVFAYGKILPKEVLDIPKEGCWNIHLSLLPKYRGASPVQWALLEGEKETGVTIMLMDEGMDTGPILLQKRLLIEEEDNAQTLLQKLSELSVPALKEALDLWKEGKLKPEPQSNEGVSYAPLIKKEDGFFTFEEPAELIVRKLKAFYPWPGIFTKYKGKLLKLYSAKVVSFEGEAKPGEVLKIDKEGILVATSRNALLLKEVQLEGKKRVSGFEFALGQRLKPGDLLTS